MENQNQKKADAIYDARELGRGRMLLLGLQHMFAMFGATVLVPILVDSYFHGEGLSVQVTLFMAGAGTLFFHLCSKFKVPAFLGSSFAFLGGFATVAELNTGIYANMSYGEKLPYACGGIVIAGLLYLVLAAVIKLIGVKRVMRFLPPVVTGPIIICIGLSLAGTAISSAKTNWLLALIALCTIVIFNIWGKGIFRIIPILMGVVVAYAAALIFYAIGLRNADGSAVMDFSRIAGSPLFGVPPFQLCKFDLTAILVMAPIAIATMMEHIGDISAISATVGENFIEDPGLHRTLIGDGLATSLSAFFGGPANTTYGENTGVRNVVENRVDFSNSRNLIIAAVILVSGLGFSKGLSFTVFGTPITLTALAIASIAGVLLNAILPGNDYHFGENQRGDAMRGVSMKN